MRPNCYFISMRSLYCFALLLPCALLLSGCKAKAPPPDTGGASTDTARTEPVSGAPAAGGPVFCQMPRVFKLAYDENYYAKDGSAGVTMKRFIKQTLSAHYYRERLSTLPEDVGTWSVSTKDSFIVYSTVEGGCTAVRHDPSRYNPFLMDSPVYYTGQFTGETKIIGNSATGYKLNQAKDLGKKVDAEIITLADYIDKDYCVPLTQDVNSSDYASHSEKVNLTSDFPDTVFRLPLECKYAPIIGSDNP